MKELELLAPARDLECGKAAIDHGADAVYIGADRFGARAAAGNSVDDISQLCRYAHRFGARVYVTVNTIIYDGELSATRQLIERLDTAGADAVLVQDMAVLPMLEGCRMAAHASTQTDNRTADKVAWLHSIGFRRTVLARELSADEIAAIHAAVPDMELEVFVHGALCVSYSGLCYASQYCFGRSANRGECAQFCRMKFELVDSSGRVIEQGRYLLSLKDMNQSDSLERLVEAGATSFKIEGRLKDSVYVKNVTAAYSRRLDEIVRRHPSEYRRASRGQCRYTFVPNLHKTFNRGFTSYFLDGRRPSVVSMDTPKAVGEYVGTVKEIRGGSFTVAGLSGFANGDGLCFVNDNRQLEGFRVNRVRNNRLFPLRMPPSLRAGMRLYRNNDQEFERLLSKPSAERKIPVSMWLEPVAGGFSLTVAVSGWHSATVTVQTEHQQARDSQRDNIIRQLTKLGGTVYECTEVGMPDGFGYFIPSSVLVRLRRQAVEALETVSRQPEAPRTAARGGEVGAVPCYPHHAYLYNIANSEARRFYLDHGLSRPEPAFELSAARSGPLMQCRHCIRYSLGYCVRHGGHKPEWSEPLYLVPADGRRFRLEFDCRRCQMNVYGEK